MNSPLNTLSLTAVKPGVSTGSDAMRLGFWAAVFTVIVTAAFAGAAVTTPARSGPFCVSDCVPYPYVDVARFIPGDYLWLVPGILLVPIFVVLTACIHAYASGPRKIFSRIALSFGLVYSVLILTDYSLQLAVVVPSLEADQTDGLSLFTQYNPHGFFIALESLGYFAMSAALLFAAPVFAGGGVERAIRGLFVLSFVLVVAAFTWLGILAHDLVAFEVIVLTIDWSVLLAGGVLLSVLFRRRAAVEAAAYAGRQESTP